MLPAQMPGILAGFSFSQIVIAYVVLALILCGLTSLKLRD